MRPTRSLHYDPDFFTIERYFQSTYEELPQKDRKEILPKFNIKNKTTWNAKKLNKKFQVKYMLTHSRFNTQKLSNFKINNQNTKTDLNKYRTQINSELNEKIHILNSHNINNFCRRCGKQSNFLHPVFAIKLTRYISKGDRRTKYHVFNNDNKIKIHEGRGLYSGKLYPYFTINNMNDEDISPQSTYNVCDRCYNIIQNIPNNARRKELLLGGKSIKTINGKKRVIYTGSRGGKYYYRIINGKKVKKYI